MNSAARDLLALAERLEGEAATLRRAASLIEALPPIPVETARPLRRLASPGEAAAGRAALPPPRAAPGRSGAGKEKPRTGEEAKHRLARLAELWKSGVPPDRIATELGYGSAQKARLAAWRQGLRAGDRGPNAVRPRPDEAPAPAPTSGATVLRSAEPLVTFLRQRDVQIKARGAGWVLNPGSSGERELDRDALLARANAEAARLGRPGFAWAT